MVRSQAHTFASSRWGPRGGAAAVVIAAALIPLLVTTPYVLRVLILGGIFVVLAVSYDLVVGQVGAFSMAQPAFYGVGAYAFAITLTRMHLSWPFAALIAIAAAATVAAVLGAPAFRLQGHSYAMATLGMLLALQLVANNWIAVTEGPMCVTGVPEVDLPLPGGLLFSTADLTATYYGILVIAVATYAFASALGRSRVGRAFNAIRENELLAQMQGVNAFRYKLTAFVISAGVAGLAGAYYASWSSLVCPSEMSLTYTITLLIIVYLGGAGSLRGVTLGAIVFTVLPELLRVADAARLVVYGMLLFFGALYMPEGFEGLIRRFWPKTGPPVPAVSNVEADAPV